MFRLLVTVLCLAGCTETGGVRLSLDLPEDPDLAPFTPRVSRLSLTARARGQVVYDATRDLSEAERVRFRDVPLGDDMWFELAGRTSTGRTLAYGRSLEAVDVRAGHTVDVALTVRRPFAYVAGTDGLLAMDATLDFGDAYMRAVPAGGNVAAARVTPDGQSVVLVVESELRLLSTSAHALGGDSIALDAPGASLTLSPDGRHAVVTHAMPTGLSIVDLGSGRATFVATDRLGDVAATNTHAWTIVRPVDNLWCVADTALARLELARPEVIDQAPLDFAAGPLAVDPTTGAAYVGASCNDKVMRFDAPGAPPVEVLSVAGPSTLAIARGRVWAMGHVDQEFARLILASVPVGGGAAESLDLPTLEERAVSVELEQTGQDGVLQMTADLAAASHMTLLPDEQHMAIRVVAGYITDPAGDAGNGQPVLPGLFMVTHEYQLVDLGTGIPSQRMRVFCDLTWDPGALLDDFRCGQAPGQDVAPISFVPSDITAIFGTR